MALSRILRIADVEEVTGLSRSLIYRKVSQKTFPAQIHLAARTVGWRESDIQQWMESLAPQAADQTPEAA